MTTYKSISGILLAVVALTTACHHHLKENKALTGIKTLPHFSLLTLDSSHILVSDRIPAGRPTVFFLFDPNCEHCQKETEGIIAHHGELESVQFYFLSNATIKEVDSFYKYYHLEKLSNVFVGTDYEYSFFNAFLPASIPYMAVYDSRKSLVKIYNGEADLSSLISYAKK